jgi:hypothetical protein
MAIGTTAAAIMGGTAILGGVLQSRAASKAAKAQQAGADAGIAEQRRQFDAIQELLKPYVQAGTPALQEQQKLAGIYGASPQRAQAQAIKGIENSPMFKALANQGEVALTQQASATGGLRGGNVQAALAQFRPNMLNNLINQQYERLGGLTGLGQSSAVGQANAGQNASNQISDLYGQRAAAAAGGIKGKYEPFANLLQVPLQAAAYKYGNGF